MMNINIQGSMPKKTEILFEKTLHKIEFFRRYY